MINPEDTSPGRAVHSASGADMEASDPAPPHQSHAYDRRSDEGAGGIGETVRAAVPSTRRFVRRHPYAGLLGAALAGVWLVRGKPLRTLGRSLMLGLAARRFLALLPSDVLGKRSSTPPSRRAPRRPL